MDRSQISTVRSQNIDDSKSNIDGFDVNIDGSKSNFDGFEVNIDGSKSNIDGFEVKISTGSKSNIDGFEVKYRRVGRSISTDGKSKQKKGKKQV